MPRRRLDDSLRLAVLIRDGNRCTYCQRPGSATLGMTADHVLPAVWGGKDVPRNLVACCVRCNTIKATMDAEAFAGLLKRFGFMTSRRPLLARVAAAMARPMPPSFVLPKK